MNTQSTTVSTGEKQWDMSWVSTPHGKTAVMIAGLAALFLALNVHLTTSLTLSVDNELSLYRQNPAVWVGQDRWGAYIVEWVFGPMVVPWVGYVGFSLLFASAFVVWLVSVTGHRDWRVVPAFAVASTAPTLWLLLVFRANVLPAGFGFLSASVALWALYRGMGHHSSLLRKSTYWMGSIVLLTLAMGMYQPFLTVFLVGVFATPLFVAGSSRDILGRWGAAFVVAVVATALSILTNRLFQAAVGVDTSAYIEQFWRPDQLLSDLVQHLTKVTLFSGAVLTAHESAVGKTAWAAALLLVVGVVVALISRTPSAVFIRVVAIAGVVLSPFAIPLLVSGVEFSPLRSLVAIPFLYGLLAVLALGIKPRKLQVAGGIVIALVGWQFMSLTGEYAATDRLRYDSDVALASTIYASLDSACGEGQPHHRVAFLGTRPFETPYADALGSSFSGSVFAWDGINPIRTERFFQALGFSDVKVTSPEDLDLTDTTLQNFPVFPSPGSVVCVEGVQVFVLSDK